jgi:uncharacterized protein YecT (DUF1311 family)
MLAACCALAGAHAGAQSQAALEKTALYELARASLDLQQIVEELRRRMPAAQRQVFDQSQRYWKKYRDSSCRFRASGADAGVRALQETTCRTEMTHEQLAALRRLAECQRGDADCPLQR